MECIFSHNQKSTLKHLKIKVIIINILVTAILAAVLELFLLMGMKYPEWIPNILLQSYQHYYRVADRNIIQVSDCGKYDSGLFYTLRQGQCIFSNREFSVYNNINAAGLRDDENSLNNPQIIVLGDSYAMGWGVEQEKTMAHQLESLTGKKVLNAGISSYGTAREIELLKRLNKDSLRHLIIQHHSNDFEENSSYLDNNFRLPISPKQKYDSIKKSIDHRRQYYPFKLLKEFAHIGVNRILARKPKEAPEKQAEKEALAFMKILERMELPAHPVKVMVFNIDSYHNLNDHFIQQVNALLQSGNYKNLNIKTISIAESLTRKHYFILDEHLNSEGHAILARKIFKEIGDEKINGESFCCFQ